MPHDDENKVNTPGIGYNRMSSHWRLTNDLLGGTAAMRAAGKRWLPMEEAESTKQYTNRLNRSFLYSAYADTIWKMVSKPFSKEVKVTDLPQSFEPMIKNIDGNGQDISQFSRDVMTAGINYGVAHILVDFSVRLDDDGNVIARSSDELNKSGELPYFVLITPNNLIGWRTSLGMDGRKRLTQIRILEDHTIKDGPFGEKVVQKITVWNESTWEVHVFDTKKDEFVLENEGPHTFNKDKGGGIPLVSYYTNHIDFMIGLPPLQKLADMNLAHWQSLSDQRNILRYSRFAILIFTGMTEDEMDKNSVIGPANAMFAQNDKANGKFIEHSGKAIQAGEQDLRSLEERMEVLGLQPMISNLANVKATGQILNEAKMQSTIQTWIRELEFTLERAFRMAGIWMGASDEEFKNINVNIYSEFSLGMKADEDMKILLEMRKTVPPQISHETFLNESIMRGILSEDLDIKVEIDAVSNEAPTLSFPPMVEDDDDSEEDEDE